MQNFDDLDIEGRNPSHLSETGKEKVIHVEVARKNNLITVQKYLGNLQNLNSEHTAIYVR